MKLNKEILKTMNPCRDGYEWYLKEGCETVENTLTKLVEVRPDWANWLMGKTLDRNNLTRSAIFSAELVLDIFEKKYPKDDRPRKAIQAAKDFLDGKIDRNAANAAYAAYAADAAADAAANAAAYAAANAAADDADAAANAAANAAADAADAAPYAARKQIQVKIINEAIRLLKGQV